MNRGPRGYINGLCPLCDICLIDSPHVDSNENHGLKKNYHCYHWYCVECLLDRYALGDIRDCLLCGGTLDWLILNHGERAPE